MLGIFGKKKIKEDKLIQIYVDTIYDVIEKGFPEIAEFINEEKQFDKSPAIGTEDMEWFMYIIYGANMLKLYDHFDEPVADSLKFKIVKEVAERYTTREVNIAEDMIIEYEKFLREQYSKTKNIFKTISLAIFYKFQLNEYQKEHYQKLNAPNPVFFKELNEMSELFIWNWDDFLAKYKIA
jgi:hypothetical protein